METELWVARDGSHPNPLCSDLWLFNAEPVVDNEGTGHPPFFVADFDSVNPPTELDSRLFPEIKPGEKRRVRLVLEPVEETTNGGS